MMTHWTISLPGGICMSYIVLIWTSGDRCQAHVRTSGDRCHVSNPTTQTHRVALARQNTLQKSFCAMNPEGTGLQFLVVYALLVV
jgi:hypothetical protein